MKAIIIWVNSIVYLSIVVSFCLWEPGRAMSQSMGSQITPVGYMAKLNHESRQKTVRIEVTGSGNGSGIIVGKENSPTPQGATTYYVLTAKHVVQNLKSKKLYLPLKIVTHDRQTYQIQPSNIATADDLDLAVVKFTSNSNYPIAQLGDYSPNSGSFIFASGYPSRERINSPIWQINPGTIFDKGTGKFVAQDKQSFTNGYDLLYTSITYGGMSGGAIFDTEGKVIGIHGAAEATGNVILGNSLGISTQKFISIIDRLKIDRQLLSINSKHPVDLAAQDRSTIIVVRDRVPKPLDESNAKGWLEYGNHLYRTNKYIEAVAAFDRAIVLEKEYQIIGSYGKMLAWLSNKDYKQAKATIQKAIDLIPEEKRGKYYYFWKYKSRIHSYLEEDNEAIKSIEIARDLEKGEDENLSNERESLFKRNQTMISTNISVFDIKSPPNNISVKNYLNQQFPSNSSNSGFQSLDSNIFVWIVRNLPKTLTYSVNRSKEMTISDYDALIYLNNRDAKAYFDRGNIKYLNGNKKSALSDYSRAISINENYIEAYWNRGLVKSDLGDKQGAIEDYTRAIAINPNDYLSYYDRGLIQLELGDRKAAIKDLDRVISMNPALANTYIDRAEVKSKLGDVSGEIADLTKAAELFRQQGETELYKRVKENIRMKEPLRTILNETKVIDPKVLNNRKH